MSALLRVATVGVNQLLLLLDLARLDVLVDVDVAFIGRYQEVTILDEDEDVEDLLAVVHDIAELGNQVPRLILLHDLLLFDELLNQLIALKLVAVACQGE